MTTTSNTDPKNEAAPQASWLKVGSLQWWVQGSMAISTLATLVASAVLSIAAISEISSRHHALAEIANTESQLINSLLRRTETDILGTNSNNSSAKPQPTKNTELAQLIYFNVHKARSDIVSLSVRGGTTEHSSVKSVMRMFEFTSSLARIQMEDLKVSPGLDEYLDSHTPFLQLSIRELSYTRNDFLLAIVVICCTLVGSIIATMREGGKTMFPPGQLALGMASGFVTFLALRGGRSVFMLDLAGEVPNFNPYSMAFSGLLVGLFTKRAYALMTLLVDELEGRLRAAVAGPHASNNTQQAATIQAHRMDVNTIGKQGGAELAAGERLSQAISKNSAQPDSDHLPTLDGLAQPKKQNDRRIDE